MQSKLTVPQKSIQCEPLVSRLDPLAHPKKFPSSLACSIPTPTASGLSLDASLFTRLTMDAALSPSIQERLLPELHGSGIGWLSGRRSDERFIKQWTSGDEKRYPRRIVPLGVDEPIDVESFQYASAIEMQLMGVPFHAVLPSRRSRWAPCMPIEIFDFEQLARKVELLRVLTNGHCSIGAAIGSGAVYEDVRFLADSGFDYVTLLSDVQYEFAANESLRLAALESSVEYAVKAINDAGTKTKLLLSANMTQSDEMFRWLQCGIFAVSVDAYLSLHRPPEPSPVRESFGSVLSYATPPASSLAWVGKAMAKLIGELQDFKTYANS